MKLSSRPTRSAACALGLLLAGAAVAPSRAAAGDSVKHVGGAVFSPQQGVICDRKSGFCADGTSISMSWTEKYLGNEAVHKFSKMIEEGSFDETDFTLSNGIRCRTKENACYKSKFSTDLAPVTKALFK